ncbi:MAG: rod shape-determining protein MreD, partial [Thermomicrobium sp.]|nr:rod shape-determining protein MreD [Thermomicrobium sp.]
MRQLVIAVLLVLASVIEVMVLPRVTPFGLFPDLVFGLVLVVSALQGLPVGAGWAVVGGLLLDLLAASPLGAHALALLPVALAGSAVRRSIYRSALLP